MNKDCELKEVELDKISLNPYQPRKEFCQQKLHELSKSIQGVGLLQPPVVRPLINEGSEYELISGERRLKAAKLAGLSKMNVIINKNAGNYQAEEALVENIQRVDLNPMEIANSLQQLIEEFDYCQDELASRIGKPRSTVANYLRLFSLPKQGQQYLSEGNITMGHAKAILSLDDLEKKLHLIQVTVEKGLSVRDCEKMAKKLKKIPKRKLLVKNNSQDIYINDIEERLRERLGTKVAVSGDNNGGKIEVEYYSLDDLDRLLNLLI